MFTNPIGLILVVAALFTAAAWSSAAIDPEALRISQADGLKGKLELHRYFARGQEPDAEENAGDGPLQKHQIVYDGIFFDDDGLD